MFGSLRRLSASSVSACILHCGLRYATIMGFTWFAISRIDGRLLVQNRFWYKCFCLLSRILICGMYGLFDIEYIFTLDNSHLITLSWIHLFSCFICATVILVMQIWYGQKVLDVANSFLRLFRRVRALRSCEHIGFGGKRELCLLIFKVISITYGLCRRLKEVLSELKIGFALTLLCDAHVTANAAMICHICFVAYLSVGTLYDQVNSYVRHELRRQLLNLEQPNGGQPSRRQLKVAAYRLDECLSIYDEIQQVANSFQRLFELPLCLILLFGFLSMSLVSYHIMLNRFHNTGLWLYFVKMLMDLLLLTLAIHGAGSRSRVVRRLSLENCYVCERNDWHIKLELFLNRLNYYEFHVRPLGLFEISNELILVFLSGLVTYLTYIIQYSMQSNQT